MAFLRHFAASVAGLAGVLLAASATAQITPDPPGQQVTGPIGNLYGPPIASITTGLQANIYVGAVHGGFLLHRPATVTRTSVPTQFIRFYNRHRPDTLGPAVGPWIATSNSVRGLTAAEVKNILALPDTPTSVAIVRVPAGTCILAGPGRPVLGHFPADPPSVPTPGPWGAAGAPQYYIVGQTSTPDCLDPQFIAPSSYITRLDMGTYALAYAPNAGGGNAGAVAVALDQADFPAPFTPMDSVYNSLDLLNFTDPEGLRSALDQLAGQPNADLQTVTIESGRMFLGLLRQQLRSGPDASGATEVVNPDGDVRTWVSSAGTHGSIDGGDTAHDFDFNLGAVAAGLDYRLLPSVRLGAAIGYAGSGFATNDVTSDGSANSYYVAFSGSYATGPLYLDAVVGYGYSDLEVGRTIAFPGQYGSTSGRTHSHAVVSAVEVGYRLRLGEATTLTPNGGLQIVSLWQDAFSEEGADALDLDAEAQSLTSVRSLLGADLQHRFGLSGLGILQADLRLAWAHDLSGTDRSVTAAFQALPSAGFTVEGAEPKRNAALVSVGLAIPGPVSVFLRYDGLYGANQTGQGGMAGISVSF